MHKVLSLALAIASPFFFWGGAIAVAGPAWSQDNPPAAAVTPDAQATSATAPAPVLPPPATPTKTVALTPEPIDLPVLTSPKGINDPITTDDLIIQSFPAKKVRDDMIRDSHQIIGMAAKRPLPAGEPLRLIDLMKEQLVRRGDDISLTYHTGALEILATGRALESGALHDSIKVTNTGSNRTVDAEVTGPKQAEIKE
jgi:flagella basal body P-ring formation protein FlgA